MRPRTALVTVAILAAACSAAVAERPAPRDVHAFVLPPVVVRDTDPAPKPVVTAATPAARDSLAREDSLLTAFDSLRAQLRRVQVLSDSTTRVYRAVFHPERWYGAALAAGVGANAVFQIDRDPGGYVDRWGSSDKWEHFSVGSFLADRAMTIGVRPRWAVALTCAGAIGFEFSQGYVSRKDIAAGCGGAAASVGLRWLAQKARFLEGRAGPLR